MNSRPCHEAAGPTAWACGLAFAAFLAAIGMLTRGFEHWTFEDLRLARAQRGELRAPPTAARTSRGEVRMLFAGNDPRAVHLVDFMYTTCPSVCLALGSEYQQMQQALDASPAPGVHLVSLSFDGARDGPAELAAYAARFGARPDRWTVAAPLTAALDRQLMQRLGVVAVADGLGGYVHNGDIHLIDGAGVVHGLYAYDQWTAALAAARRLAAASP
jgi:protein SCO1/2